MQVGLSLLYSHLAVSMRNIYVSNINKDSVICRRARLVLPCCQERARAVSEFFRRRKVGQKGVLLASDRRCRMHTEDRNLVCIAQEGSRRSQIDGAIHHKQTAEFLDSQPSMHRSIRSAAEKSLQTRGMWRWLRLSRLPYRAETACHWAPRPVLQRPCHAWCIMMAD